MPALPEKGMIHLASSYSAKETVERLQSLLAQRKLPLLALIDHSKAAADVGIEMRPAVLLIFGNPRAGSPLMIAAPTLAIDLPLKALVWEDGAGAVWLSYNTPEYLGHRHDVPDHLLKNISGIGSLLEEVVGRS